MKPQTLTVIAFGIFFVGCASTHYVTPSKYPPKSAASVAILFQEPNRPYEVITFVQGIAVTIFDSAELLMQRAREQAAAAGADAVIFSTTGQQVGMITNPRTAAGRAIKWK